MLHNFSNVGIRLDPATFSLCSTLIFGWYLPLFFPTGLIENPALWRYTIIERNAVWSHVETVSYSELAFSLNVWQTSGITAFPLRILSIPTTFYVFIVVPWRLPGTPDKDGRSKNFNCIMSFNPHDIPVTYCLYNYLPFWWWRHWGTERLRNVPKITAHGTRVWTQVLWL